MSNKDTFEYHLQKLDHLITPSGETAWSLDQLDKIMTLARTHQRIILGGDVLTLSGSYTCNNWYFTREANTSHEINVEKSIQMCQAYVASYVQRNGSDCTLLIVFKGAQGTVCVNPNKKHR